MQYFERSSKAAEINNIGISDRLFVRSSNMRITNDFQIFLITLITKKDISKETLLSYNNTNRQKDLFCKRRHL